MSAADLTAHFSGVHIAIAGDVMLDHFLIGRVDRISPEAPVPVVCFEREEYRLGGAANVAANIAALGGRPEIVGLTGDDEAAAELRKRLTEAGIPDAGLVSDARRPTTRSIRLSLAGAGNARALMVRWCCASRRSPGVWPGCRAKGRCAAACPHAGRRRD